MNIIECPKCKSSNAVGGRLVRTGRSATTATSFSPGGIKRYQFSLEGGAELQPEAFACPDCGLVWTQAADSRVLRELLTAFAKK